MSNIFIPANKIEFGFYDATNYTNKKNSAFFNKAFFIDETLDEVCDENKFFILGEKGTGKTAYAAYVSNNGWDNNVGVVKNISQADYSRFISMKKDKQLALSDFNN